MSTELYQHFRKEEQAFIDRVNSWMLICAEQYSPYLTDFLDPRQQFIVESVVGRSEDIHFQFWGGYNEAERKRCCLYPSYYQPTAEDFEMTCFEIHYPKKFAELGHGRILGSLTGAGVDRSVLGDIISDGENWQVFLAQNMVGYIKEQVQKIGKVSVRLEEVSYVEQLTPLDHWMIEHTTVSSLRLDTLISSVFNISRQRSKQLVEGGKVKVNWTLEERPDFELDLLDIISIRGFGRIQIRKVEGRTKKEKLKLEIGKLEKNKR